MLHSSLKLRLDSRTAVCDNHQSLCLDSDTGGFKMVVLRTFSSAPGFGEVREDPWIQCSTRERLTKSAAYREHRIKNTSKDDSFGLHDKISTRIAIFNNRLLPCLNILFQSNCIHSLFDRTYIKFIAFIHLHSFVIHTHTHIHTQVNIFILALSLCLHLCLDISTVCLVETSSNPEHISVDHVSTNNSDHWGFGSLPPTLYSFGARHDFRHTILVRQFIQANRHSQRHLSYHGRQCSQHSHRGNQ